METWHVDAVLHDRLGRHLTPRGLTVGDWVADALHKGRHGPRRDVDVSTMGMDQGRIFRVIDEPCGARIPLRLTFERDTRIVHVREMPLGRGVTYVDYGPIDVDHDVDEHEMWDRPVLLCVGTVLPDTACAALTGRLCGEIVDTGIATLDRSPVAWGRMERKEVYVRLLREQSAGALLPPALLMRLKRTPKVAVEVEEVGVADV